MKKTATTIIKEYEFDTIIGVYDFERIKPQRVRLNVEYSSSEFIDYTEVIEFIKNTYNEYKFEYVENSLEIISEILKTKFASILNLKIEIYKLEVVKNAVVGAKLEVIY